MQQNVFKDVYTRLLSLYTNKFRPRRYCVDSSMVKNVYGRDKLGRNPVDRGRKGSKITVVVDHHGIVHSLYSCGANISDMKLLGVVLKHPLHKPLVKRIELYADKGYDKFAKRICE